MRRLPSLCLGWIVCIFLIFFVLDVTAQTVDICSRTYEVRVEILARISHDDCKTVPETDLSNLTIVDISGNLMQLLDKDDFAGLSGLRTLNLDNNAFLELPEGIFDGLPNLIWLELGDNPTLADLDEDVFEGLENLASLYIYTTAITEVHEDLFDGLSNLKTLYLSSNPIEEFPEDLFDGLSQLGEVAMESNQLTTLPKDIFDETTKEGLLVRLKGNPIVCLPQKILDQNESGKISISFDKDIVIQACVEPEVTLTLTPKELPEGETAEVTARLSSVSVKETTIDVSVVPNTPATTDDYRLSDNTILTVAAGETESSGVVTITAVDDVIDEQDETLTVSGHAENPFGVTGPEDQLLTIQDNDAATEITFSVSPSVVSEDGGDKKITVTASLDVVRSTDTPVTISVGLGTATSGVDYDAVPSFVLPILSNQTVGVGEFTLSPIPDDLDEPPETIGVNATTRLKNHEFTVVSSITLTDGDPTPVVRLNLAPNPIEEGESTTVTAYLNAPSSKATTITISAEENPPALNSDYFLSVNKVLTIAPEAKTSSGEVVTITAAEDQIDGPDKTIVVSGLAENGHGITGPENITLTILDDDEASEIKLTLDPEEVREDAGSKEIKVAAALDVARTSDTKVIISVGGGTAVAGTDFTVIDPLELTISENQTEGIGMLTFIPITDNLDESDESILITGATSVDGLQVIATTLTLIDVDPMPTVTLMLSSEALPESDGFVTVTARLNARSSAVTTITISTAANLPATDSDYLLSSQPILTIDAGETASTGLVTITPVDNDVDEPDKIITVSGQVTNPIGLNPPSDVTLKIIDDDVATGISLAVVPPDVNEDAGSSSITVTASLDVARSTDTEIDISVESETALSGIDFATVPPFSLTILPKETVGTGTFTFTPIADGMDEPEETVQITGTTGSGGLPVSSATLTIIDSDRTPEVRLVLSPASIPEASGISSITAQLASPSSAETVIEVSVFPDPPATPEDYSLSSSTILTIAPGMTTSTGEVTIMAIDNPVDAPDKMVTVSGQAENVQGVTGPSDVTLTILDDDEATGITLVVSPPGVNEDAGSVEIKVMATLDVPRSENTEVVVSVGDGTAKAGSDYVAVPSSNFTILANESTGSTNFDLVLLDDLIHEPQETILIIGGSPAFGDGETETFLTILDNDELIQLSVQDQIVSEDVGLASIQIDVTPAAPIALSVPVQTVQQSALDGEDYTGGQVILQIPPGETTGILEIPIIDDKIMESSETFQVVLSDVEGTVLDPGKATVTIEDNDSYRLRVLDASANESDPEITFTVTLDPPHPSETVRVEYETADRTATAITDYITQRSVLNFPAGSSRQEISVLLVDDYEEEIEETFQLRLFAPEHAKLVDAEAIGTIVDDDAPPVASINPSIRVQESAGLARFEVTLTHALPGRNTEVSFLITDETAKAPLDYQVQTLSPLRFLSGQTAQFIDVQIVDDDIYEVEETFQIQLSGAQNGQLGQSDAKVIIVDNEDPVMASIQDIAVIESGQEAVFQVILSGLDSQPRTFTYTTEDETAEAGQDYSAVSGTVTFVAETIQQEIIVPILDDQTPERTEIFRVRLAGVGISDGEGHGMILDDDGPLTVSILDQSVSEGAGELLLPVHLNRPSPQLVTVQFTSSDQSANSEFDYVTSKGIVIFQRGSLEGKIRIQVLEDSEVEPDETFQVTLSKPRNVAIDRGIGTGTILDNDGSPTISVQSVTVSRDLAIFDLNLSIPSPVPVLVSYASEDGSAQAGQDYEPVSGQITFAPGEISKTVGVKLLSHKTGFEAKTFSLVLLSAVNAEVQDAREEAVIEEESEENIRNAYISRVLRTWASQVVEAFSRRVDGMAECRIPDLSWLQYRTERRSLGQIFRGCGAEFTYGGWSVWGQGAFTRMRGRDGSLSLRSDITTMLVGADYVWSQGWMAGLVAAQSWDQGTYETASLSGSASSRLTGFYPYVSYQTAAGMRAWMLFGLGRGETEVETLESEVDAALVALGLIGTLTSGTSGRLGYELDAFWAIADLEDGSDLGVRRVRAGVEGILRFGQGMEPYMEAALRQDGGDAETGMGVELGGGIRWSTSRLRVELGGRTLVLHTDEGMREWGLMGAIEYRKPSQLGPSMRVRPLWGNVYGGDLWRDAPLHSVALGGTDQRVEMELGYGMPIRQSLGQSIIGMTVDPRGHSYRVGYNLHVKHGLQFSVATTARTLEANKTPPSYGLSGRMDLRW